MASHQCFIGWSSKFASSEGSIRGHRFVQKANFYFRFVAGGCRFLCNCSDVCFFRFWLHPWNRVPVEHGTLPLSCHSFFCSIQASASTWHLKQPWCGPLWSVVSFGFLGKDSRMSGLERSLRSQSCGFELIFSRARVKEYNSRKQRTGWQSKVDMPAVKSQQKYEISLRYFWEKLFQGRFSWAVQ